MSDFCLSCEVIFTPKVLKKANMKNSYGGYTCPYCEDEMLSNDKHNKNIDTGSFKKTIIKNGIAYYPL